MFGYIKPYKPYMRFIEWDIYKGVYCSICHRMVKRFGILSGFFISYDSTFLALLLLSLSDKKIKLIDGRCRYNPLKKCKLCMGENEILDFAGAISIILFYHKLKDNISDSKFIKKIFSRLIKFLIKYSYKRAKESYGDLESIVNDCMKLQELEEKSPFSNIDSSCDPTAKMVSAVLSVNARDEREKRILSSLGYFLGRWIYLADALDDLESDLKKHEYNPLINLYGLKTEQDLENSDVYDYCNDIMNQTVSQIVASYNLLEIRRFKSILDNIINMGICSIQKQIINRRGRREKNERSI